MTIAQPMRQAAIKFTSAALANGGLADDQITTTLAHIIPNTQTLQMRMLEIFGYGTEAKPYPTDKRAVLARELSVVLRHGKAPRGLDAAVTNVLSLATQPAWQALAFMPSTLKAA